MSNKTKIEKHNAITLIIRLTKFNIASVVMTNKKGFIGFRPARTIPQ